MDKSVRLFILEKKSDSLLLYFFATSYSTSYAAGPPGSVVAVAGDNAETMPLDVSLAADLNSTMEVAESPIHDPEEKRQVFQKGKKPEKRKVNPKDDDEKDVKVYPSGSKEKPVERKDDDDDEEFSDSLYHSSENEEARFETIFNRSYEICFFRAKPFYFLHAYCFSSLILPFTA